MALDAHGARRRHKRKLRKAGVVGTGVGYKETGGEVTDELAVTVFVERKVPLDSLGDRDVVPKEVGGVRTDVVEVGHVKALEQDQTARWRPAPGGVTISTSRNYVRGTLGCLVQKGDKRFILSNNHVMADTNRAKIGSLIYQPWDDLQDTSVNIIGALDSFVPVRFDDVGWAGVRGEINRLARRMGLSCRLQGGRVVRVVNCVDAALAWSLVAADYIEPRILYIGEPKGVRPVRPGLAVQKTGSTTGHTTGTVRHVDVTIRVDYGGRIATFEDQVIASRMSAPGDSGSAVLDMDGYVVGLLFSGSDLVTIFNPIGPVLRALGVELVV